MHRVADGGGGIHQGAQLDGPGQRRLQFRHQADDAVHYLDDIGPRLLGDVDQHGRLAVEGTEIADILDPVHHFGHILQPYSRTVAVGNDQRLVLAGRAGDVVGIELEDLVALLDIALGSVGVGGRDGGAHIR